MKQRHKFYTSAIAERKKVENLKIIDINDIVNDLVSKIKGRFYRFTFICGIGSRQLRGFPRDIRIRKYKQQLQDVVDWIIALISSYCGIKYRFYMRQPKPMIETKLAQMLDKNPKLLQHFQYMQEPIIRQITLKYWVQEYIEEEKHISFALFGDYINTEPHETLLDLKNTV